MADLSRDDISDIRGTLAMFSHAFDNKDLEALSRVFAEDGVLELTKGAGRVIGGLRAIGEFAIALGADAPDHHTLDTHVYVAEGVVRARSRYLAILPDGSVHNGDYLDELRQTPDGWRIGRRVSIPRFPR
ncbi:nuclear transport factor 2 family protein [Nonomuraea typhae]|uniref:nuclear transport factor 2 family protein n=1 Tax=Nonomuraea typhae TaxID=2603600 RepID=UPI0012FC1508|nr:nuclear transport factor 2 family protein [Nonomuraea typhae]